jgi:hypothetical protein
MEEDQDEDWLRRRGDLIRVQNAPPGHYAPDPEGIIPDAISEFYCAERVNGELVEDLEKLRLGLNGFLRKERRIRVHFGFLLMQAKEALGPGKFGDWLSRAFPLHHRTANKWMDEARKYNTSRLELSSNSAYKLHFSDAATRLETKEQTRIKKILAEQAQAGKLLLLLSKRLNGAEMNYFFGLIEQTSIKQILNARPHIDRLADIPEIGPIPDYLRRPEDSPAQAAEAPALGDPPAMPEDELDCAASEASEKADAEHAAKHATGGKDRWRRAAK